MPKGAHPNNGPGRLPAHNTLLRQGAEGCVIFVGSDLGPAVVKRRNLRSYRLPQVDMELSRARLKREAQLLRAARAAGVLTPLVYDLDLDAGEILMEYIEGDRLKDHINGPAAEPGSRAGAGSGPIAGSMPGPGPEQACRICGEMVAAIHRARICHGDLTTSNFIVSDRGIFMIDMGLGERDCGLEDMAVDMRTFERAFESTHPEMGTLWDVLLQGYCDGIDGETKAGEGAGAVTSKMVLRTMDDVKARARYV